MRVAKRPDKQGRQDLSRGEERHTKHLGGGGIPGNQQSNARAGGSSGQEKGKYKTLRMGGKTTGKNLAKKKKKLKKREGGKGGLYCRRSGGIREEETGNKTKTAQLATWLEGRECPSQGFKRRVSSGAKGGNRPATFAGGRATCRDSIAIIQKGNQVLSLRKKTQGEMDKNSRWTTQTARGRP